MAALPDLVHDVPVFGLLPELREREGLVLVDEPTPDGSTAGPFLHYVAITVGHVEPGSFRHLAADPAQGAGQPYAPGALFERQAPPLGLREVHEGIVALRHQHTSFAVILATSSLIHHLIQQVYIPRQYLYCLWVVLAQFLIFF